MNYFQKLEDAAPPRRSPKAIALSLAILVVVFFWNTNYMPYLLGVLTGAININPESIPLDTIRSSGNIVLLIAFIAVGWKNDWSKTNAKN